MKKIIYILAMVIATLFSSCESFLEENPQSFASPEMLMSTESGITQSLHGVYNAFYKAMGTRYYVQTFGLPGDEYNFYWTTRPTWVDLQNFTFNSYNDVTALVWNMDVYGINRANIILEGIPKDIANTAFGKRAIAEASFLRAWFYFTHVRAFGAVPLITSIKGADFFPSNGKTDEEKQQLVAEIYDLIVADLKVAEQGLPGWQEITEAEKGRATKGAAKSALAMVYLTRATSDAAKPDDMSNAASKAKEVIDNEGYGLWDNYMDVFSPVNKNDKEDIFSCQFQQDSDHSSSLMASFSCSPTLYDQPAYTNFYVMPMLYNSLDDNDERKKIMLYGKYITVGGVTKYTKKVNGEFVAFTQKYHDPIAMNRSNHSVNIPLIRYANVLLMFAEAENELNGPTEAAYSALNLVHQRSDLPALANLSKEEFRQAVRDERWVEFLGEGIRWFDLQRWGILKERVELARPGVTVDMPKHKYFPIPQKEIDANPNLKQNTGY